MITATDLTLRAGARTLIESASFTIARGDRIGLVGRNGAGKTTLARVLAGEGLADGGTIARSGAVGYLPQGPSEGDTTMTARDRVLSGRGMDAVLRELRSATDAMAAGDRDAIERYARLEDQLTALGGYGAEAEAASIAASLGLPARLLDHQLRMLSGGQRRRGQLARTALSMEKRAERLLAGVAEVRRSDRVARLRFPDPAPCGRVVLTARGLSKGFGSTEVFTGVDLEVERASRTVVLGVNGAGKTTLLRVVAGLEQPEAGLVIAGHGLKLGYYAQEHETLRTDRTVLDNMRAAAPEADLSVVRGILGSFLFSGDTVDQEVRTLSGGEKTRLALAALVVSGANLLLLDEPTNNLDPASREEVLTALAGYRGAVLLVTHDEGAVQALRPQRVVLMPEGITDWWDASLSELVSMA